MRLPVHKVKHFGRRIKHALKSLIASFCKYRDIGDRTERFIHNYLIIQRPFPSKRLRISKLLSSPLLGPVSFAPRTL